MYFQFIHDKGLDALAECRHSPSKAAIHSKHLGNVGNVVVPEAIPSIFPDCAGPSSSTAEARFAFGFWPRSKLAGV